MRLSRIISIFVALTILLLSVTALSEEFDFTSMPFEKLSAIKRSLETEYYSRPESEGFFLSSARYDVGTDILPGRYYIAMAKPGNARIVLVSIYKNQEDFNNKNTKNEYYLSIENGTSLIFLNENEIMTVENSGAYIKSSDFNPSDLYTYTPPEGTFVPKGKYIVGTDLPAGTYYLYPSECSIGSYKAYAFEMDADGHEKRVPRTTYDSYYKLEIFDNYDHDTLTLIENDILEVFEPLIMIKESRTVLKFD